MVAAAQVPRPHSAAIAPRHHAEAGLIAGQRGVLLHLEVLLDRVPALAGLRVGLDRGGSLLHQRQHRLGVVLGAEPVAGAGMAGDHAIPVHRDHLLDEVLGLERIDVDEAAARECADRDRVDDEHDLLLRQPHHQGRVGVVEPEIAQFERRAAELDRLLVADQLVRHDRVRVLQHLQPRGRVLVRDHARAGVLERLAAGDVVEVVVAVDQVFDRLVGDLLDLVDILLPAGRASIGDRIGRDDAVLGDDEHRLMIAIAEDVDAFGAVDLLGFDLRPLRLGGGRDGERHRDRGCGAGKQSTLMDVSPFGRRANACGERTPHARLRRAVFQVTLA